MGVRTYVQVRGYEETVISKQMTCTFLSKYCESQIAFKEQLKK
jgi:hypothetical protein